MPTLLYTHPACARHVTPPGHPERVARIEAVQAALSTPEFATLERRDAPRVAREEIRRVHPEAYIAEVEAAIPADAGWRSLDADTHVVTASLEAAERAAGAVCAAVDAVVAGEARNAFCAVRPPGHHAERSTAMGFCLFGSIAIGAKRALDHHRLSRVAVVDFDVHHGNGTQDLLWDEPRSLFASTHQMPLYPGSGAVEETGAANNVLNVPLPPGAGGTAFRQAMEASVLPALDAFRPDLVLVSAGFDGHADDPLANLELREDDFAWVTQRLCDLAEAHAGGRLVSALEGGYDLEALAASTAAHVRVLKERSG